MKLLLTTYFEGVTPNLDTLLLRRLFRVCMLTSYMVKMTLLDKRLPSDWLLSAGLIRWS